MQLYEGRKTKLNIEEKNCIICGVFMPRNTRSGTKRVTPEAYRKRKYCSYKCRGVAKSIEISGKNNPNYKKGLPNCSDCGANLVNKKANLCRGCWSKSISGENSPNWRGGVRSYYDLLRSSSKLATWRSKVYKRDNYTCQECGDNTGGNLNADHIKPFALILKENNITSKRKGLMCVELWDINNGRTLCVNCHKKTPTYGYKTIKLIK